MNAQQLDIFVTSCNDVTKMFSKKSRKSGDCEPAARGKALFKQRNAENCR